MKTLTLTILSFIYAITLSAKDIVINQPSFELTTSGIYHIKKIELTGRETKLYIHATFIPKWWVKFPKKTFIQDVTSGEKYYPTAIKGGEFEKEIYMGPSGDSSFVLIFPELPKSIKKLNYGEENVVTIFGISIDPKAQPAQKEKQIPAGVQTWLDTEQAKAKRKSLIDYNSPDFFAGDTSRLIGYIKGYDQRLGFSTGIIYAGNEITNEDYPITVAIHQDGRFEASIPMPFPTHTYIHFQKTSVNFYLEPGQTLSMILNWDEFLLADRFRNIRHELKDIIYSGPAAQVNKDLSGIQIKTYNYADLQKAVPVLTPGEFKKTVTDSWISSKSQLKQATQDRAITPQAGAILQSEIDVSYATILFDFLSSREYQAGKDSSNKILRAKAGQGYYDFLQNMDLNDRTLLISPDFSVFVNRFEFDRALTTIPNKDQRTSFTSFLFTDLKLKPTGEDQSYIGYINAFGSKFAEASREEKSKLVASSVTQREAFEKKYSKYLAQYNKRYPPKEPLSLHERIQGEWSVKDTILKNYFKLQHNLVYDILKSRSLKFIFSNLLKDKKEESRNYLSTLERGMKDESVLAQAEGYFQRTFPSIAKNTYDLPPGKATDIFRKVIDQHKGKILFVDFWGIYCGPCIASIKKNKPVRESYTDSKDIEFLFLTSYEESPEDRYKEFVKEQELQHTYRLPSDDFIYLRQLFKFNGIPRYIVINKEGQVMNDDFQMHNFETELKKLLAQK